MSEDLNDALFAAVSVVRGADPGERAALVRSLVEAGADVLARDERGGTPLHRAAAAPYDHGDPLPSLEVVRALLECGADVHAVDNLGTTPAAWAVASNDDDPATWAKRSVKVLTLLVEYGARLDGASRSPGNSLAHECGAAPRVYAFLLDHGAPIDSVNSRGDTPLHDAVSAYRPANVRLLLDRGANTGGVNHLGQTPLGIALRLVEHSELQRQAHAEIVAMLEAVAAPPHDAYDAMDGGPVPIDMPRVRQIADYAGRADRAVRGCWYRDDSDGLTKMVSPDFDSYQDFVEYLRLNSEYRELLVLCPGLCAASLSGTGTTRTAHGDPRIDDPYFHHGDLTVEGDLTVQAPFLVTGSLTVTGVLRDCGPDSIVVVGGGVTARGVHTDGEMEVVGDIEADVVYGHYNDNTLQARTIRARLVIEDEHATSESVVADHHYDIDHYPMEGVQEELRTLLVDEVFSFDGGEEDEDDEEYDDEDDQEQGDDEIEYRLDRHRLFKRLSKGLPVFRTDQRLPSAEQH